MKEKLFNLPLFNPEFAVFPKMVFKEVFDYHYFMFSNHWFDSEEDFNMLRIFMEAINEPYLYCAVPDFDNCPDLKIDMSLGHVNFKSQYLMQDQAEHPYHNIGLRISSTGFWWGDSGDWAMVSDLTNNIMIVGCKPDVSLNFRADFGGKYFGIEKVIQNMEEFHHILEKRQNPEVKYAEMDGKLEVIERYK
jgi:hypothetical protein